VFQLLSTPTVQERENESEGVLCIYIKLAFQMSLMEYSKMKNKSINLLDFYLLSSRIYKHTQKTMLLVDFCFFSLTNKEGQIDHYQPDVVVIVVFISKQCMYIL
jgi:hypothetical protein